MSADALEEILNALVPFARSQIEAHGAFAPFAGGLDRDGEVELLMPGGGDASDTGELLALLRLGLRSTVSEGGYLATGVCVDVTAQREEGAEPVDAICVELESSRECLAAYVPYVREEDGHTLFGDVFFGAHEPEVFSSEDGEDDATAQSMP